MYSFERCARSNAAIFSKCRECIAGSRGMNFRLQGIHPFTRDPVLQLTRFVLLDQQTAGATRHQIVKR